MKNSNPMRKIWLLLFAASAISAAHGQDNTPAPNNATENRVPAVPKPTASLPSAPPNVACKGNQLTVAANNSTLVSILNEVQRCTGAKIDIPSGAAEIRFFDTIGPLPIREVLSTLLTASGYDFVIQASDSDPGKVETVLLIARTGPIDTPTDRPATPARKAFLKMRQDALTEAGITGDNTSSAQPENSEDQKATPPPNTSPENTAAANAPSDANQASAPSPLPAAAQENAPPVTQAPETPPSQSQPKTVEDQITNMQQMFEQRRQMMQTPPPTSPQP